MKLIGLLGGMSWESTALYYRLMNEETKHRLGGLHSARILLHSVDFHDIERRQHDGDWEGTADILSDAACGLKSAGADFLVIATNTMHKVADAIETRSGLPILHIADPTGQVLVAGGVARVALLGTRFTMEQDFYRNRLERHYGLEVVLPNADARAAIHRIIYEELCQGKVLQPSAVLFADIIADLAGAGAQAVILGCTEITMIVDPATAALPTYDTTALHATAAIKRALAA
ncbi:MAG: aspartate/glutamate racemase family protein [Alphaproteobacteria bacterium]|nr:aspartate/glutamate racemase family protein [Alphaproteobacteria bacterium]